MPHPHTMIRNPETPSHLHGLSSVAITCQLDVVGVTGIRPERLIEVASRLLMAEGLAVNMGSESRLVISIATELRPEHGQLVYGVVVALQDPAILKRHAADGLECIVDSWRHQRATGVIFFPYTEAVVREALGQEAMRQVLDFLQDWKGENRPPAGPVLH